MAMLLMKLTLLSALAAGVYATPAESRPATASVRGRQHLQPGDDALLTCIVHRLGDSTVLWRRTIPQVSGQRSEVLTAGDSRVSSDPRLRVLHDTDAVSSSHAVPGGDVYVLVIHNVTVWDSGMYVCEVNSRPPIRTFHQMTVISTSLEAPPNHPVLPSRPTADHDFRRCCRRRNVTEDCLQLCTLQGMSSGGGLADYDRCQTDFPSIYNCMADGRDHLACCVDQGVPARCGHLCRGHYVLQEVSLREYFSCRDVTEVIVNCVSLGIETLPVAPGRLEVNARSLTALRISWVPGLGHVTAPRADWFTVNVTRQRSFDGDKMALLPSNTTELTAQPIVSEGGNVQLFNVSGTRRSLAVSDLHPLTMYEVSVTAHNAAGASLRSGQVRAVTWVPETRAGTAQPPALPDVRRCCSDRGVTEPRCLRNLCDPARASATDYTDMIVCAPWTGTTLSCMADGGDHGDCCRARGLPPLCVQMCSANVEQIDYRYFPCLQYMSSYASCLMQGYGVVPSAPLQPRVALTDSEFTVLRWNEPESLPETVLSYTVWVRLVNAGDDSNYTATERVHSPFLLDHLVADQKYEFYVTAVNRHGDGAQSSRVVFTTLSQFVPEAEEAADQSAQVSDVASCCRNVGVTAACQRYCNASQQLTLATTDSCTTDRHKILRCLVAGRDLLPCCRHRQLPDPCLPDCRGQGPTPDVCRIHTEAVLLCLAEGLGQLPPPVTDLRVTHVTGDTVTLVWQAPDAAQQYQVRYGKVNQTGGIGSSVNNLNQTVNVTGSGEAQLSNLTSDAVYAFTVVAVNEHGSSLAASVVTVNVTDGAAVNISGSVSAPHSLGTSEISDSAITLTWAPPVIAPHNSSIRYRVYYRSQNESEPQTVDTVGLSDRLENLQPNTAYDVYVTAASEERVSRPSEMLETWTTSQVPIAASVQLPKIEPPQVMEGDNMTVLCDAVGMPVPTIQLYISGEKRNQSRTHLLVTSISDVRRHMDRVTCVADNGRGASVHATRYIIIRRRPVVTSEGPELVVSEGGTITLRCYVDASPRPTMTWRGPRSQNITGSDDNYNVTEEEQAQEGHYTMELTIDRAEADNFGQYSCNAQNMIGSNAKEITLNQRPEPPRLYQLGVAECCRRLNVSQPCQGACAEQEVDLEAVLATPGCVREFSKLMSCAADGSDHSDCCSARSVPDHCLSWCEGRPTTDRPDCAVRYATDVIGCFEEGKELIPGPPRNIQVEMINTSDAVVSWDPPSRNADKVVIYRLSWRRLDEGSSAHLDTRRTRHTLSGLEPLGQYQLSVVAANRHGNSLEATHHFTGTAGPTAAQSTDETTLGSGAVLGLALVLAVLVLVLVLGGTWLVRHRRLKGAPGNHISFANPTYLRETGRDGGQEFPDAALSARSRGESDGGASGGRLNTSGYDGWQEAALETPVHDHQNGL